MRFLIVFFVLIFFNCSNSDEAAPEIVPFIGSSCDKDIGMRDPCPDEIFCDLSYLSISVTVADEAGEPIIFTETELLDQNTGRMLEFDADMPAEFGYVIAEDYMVDFLPGEGHCLQLSGFIKGELALHYPFLVGHDYCHVELLAGP